MHWRKLTIYYNTICCSFFLNLQKRIFLGFQACRKEGACNLIFIKSHKDETEEADDFVINSGRNKTNILEAIILCLEQPLCKRLQEWSNLYSKDSDVLSDINALCKMRLNHDDETDVSEIPEDLKKYLNG